MIALTATDIIAAKAQTAATITVTITGDEVTGGNDTFKVLYQGQPGTSFATVYTVPGASIALVKQIAVVNTAGTTQTFALAVKGTAAANLITPDALTLPANGFATYDDDGWRVYDSAGKLQTSAGSGATGGQGPAGPPIYEAPEAEEPWPAPPGRPGDPGGPGTTGGQGPIGPPVYLEAPEGDEGPMGPPSQVPGPTGGQGPIGPPVYLEAPEGDEGPSGPPSQVPGPPGGTGGQGPIGPPVYLEAPEADEAWALPTPGAPGTTGGQGPIGPAVFLEAPEADELFVMPGPAGRSPLTTKGDLFGRDASGDSRLAVGTDKQIIVADSSQPLGLLWTFSLKIPTSGITAPIYLDFDNTYTDRKASLTIRDDTNGVPTNVEPALHILHRSKGDNATFIGGTAIYAQTRDRSDVTGANKGVIYGVQVDVNPLVARSNSPFDDADGVVVNNSEPGAFKATDAFYIAHNAAFGTNREWITGYQVDTNADYAFFTGSGRNFTGGLELRGTFSATAIKVAAKASSVFANAALLTSATDGFIYIPSCAGVPTGVPTTQTGTIPLVYDSLHNILYAYSNGAWQSMTGPAPVVYLEPSEGVGEEPSPQPVPTHTHIEPDTTNLVRDLQIAGIAAYLAFV
jgi:hypothetical protein